MQTEFYSRIGSVTKTITVAAVLQLVDQGKLTLERPISKYIAGVPSGDQITLRELAQMRADWSQSMTCPSSPTRISRPAPIVYPSPIARLCARQTAAIPAGTQYYCNTNTVLLGLVVEQQSGQRLPDYISEHILAPLKLTHTSFPTTQALPDPHAQGYTVLRGAEQIATDWNPSWGWGWET